MLHERSHALSNIYSASVLAIWRMICTSFNSSSSSKTNSLIPVPGLSCTLRREAFAHLSKENCSMIDAHDFTRWVRTQTPVWLPFFRDYLISTSVVVKQSTHHKTGECRHPLFHSRRCYRVDFTPHGLALHCLTPHGNHCWRITTPRPPYLQQCWRTHCWRVCLAE